MKKLFIEEDLFCRDINNISFDIKTTIRNSISPISEVISANLGIVHWIMLADLSNLIPSEHFIIYGEKINSFNIHL